uniref:Uncharacterized protein n=1 Tax=Arundo donax TaxID=35708 RepID=A0A0A9B7R6_ARUDO
MTDDSHILEERKGCNELDHRKLQFYMHVVYLGVLFPRFPKSELRR